MSAQETITVKTAVHAILSPYQKAIENAIKTNSYTFGEDGTLKEACQYALLNGGKRFRPALVYIVAKAIGTNVDVTHAALAVEYFHTASLIADDLPCMDDDDERRNKPSLHKAYGEATALLVTYALISAGYRCLAENSEHIRLSDQPFADNANRICVLALMNAAYNTGIHGATGGQFLDIFPPQLNIEVLKEIHNKKTTSLFELSFVLGWLYGGGEIEKLSQVKKAAAHFGLAFQIADDIDDMVEDALNERTVNLATLFGKDRAINMFHGEISNYKELVKNLMNHTNDLILLSEHLEAKVFT